MSTGLHRYEPDLMIPLPVKVAIAFTTRTDDNHAAAVTDPAELTLMFPKDTIGMSNLGKVLRFVSN